MYDAVIIGGGPAGLSAALILGRCRRRVLLCDAGRPRNAAAREMHGFLTRDAIAPAEFLRIARAQLGPYPGVEVRPVEVTDAVATDGHYELTLHGGERVRARKLLLATGVTDDIPQLPGIEPLYGRSVFHCPYCDGWEVRDQPLAAYGKGRAGYNFATELTVWSDDIVLCTDGPAGLGRGQRARLARLGIGLREERITRLEGGDGALERVVFAEGEPLERRALFFSTGYRQGSPLPQKLGCKLTPKGAVRTGSNETTRVHGLWVAGDASREVQLVVVAAAEGAKAAFAINQALLKEDLQRRVGKDAPRARTAHR